jgi:hypothetical protein
MEVPVQQIIAVSHPSNGTDGAEGALRTRNRPTIQAKAAAAPIYFRVYGVVCQVMEPILQRLRQGSTLGPLCVFALVLIYSLLSSRLPAPIHAYIYHIAH